MRIVTRITSTRVMARRRRRWYQPIVCHGRSCWERAPASKSPSLMLLLSLALPPPVSYQLDFVHHTSNIDVYVSISEDDRDNNDISRYPTQCLPRPTRRCWKIAIRTRRNEGRLVDERQRRKYQRESAVRHVSIAAIWVQPILSLEYVESSVYGYEQDSDVTSLYSNCKKVTSSLAES